MPLSRLAFLLLVLAAGCQTAPTGGAAASLEPLRVLQAGDALPAFSLPDLAGDGTLTHADLAGEPAVLNFWATWCAFCVDEMPDFEEAHRAIGDRVAFVGVNREDNFERAKVLAAETGVTYRLVVDDQGAFFRAVQARGMPTTVFVDTEGRIAYRHAGPLTSEALLGLIDEHLGLRPGF